ncbi:82dcf7de-07dc-4d2d-8b86-f43d2239d810 [Sclerotinia trifoliorum]|uniref:82dcf7de-07dc-4d2d-8b86-f43d2239d810 n=1 Tax=Sclerotinia trifoliorum TaxID=28548 RepID=A0A8H2VR95_9HELO|nr:82dcf7de-07dc-4d2d-8b86-f43d2239d810 [Sclerotinia trifoliorum]
MKFYIIAKVVLGVLLSSLSFIYSASIPFHHIRSQEVWGTFSKLEMCYLNASRGAINTNARQHNTPLDYLPFGAEALIILLPLAHHATTYMLSSTGRLSDGGMKQALAFAKSFKDAHHITHIFCSPEIRCKQTAEVSPLCGDILIPLRGMRL